MCCFSGPVERVADTRIFARLFGRGGGSQFLVYQMTYAAPRAVAMILPLPVVATSPNPVRFVDLKGYPDFFGDLDREFPQLRGRGGAGGGGFGGGPSDAAPTLPVVAVGDFVASYVPTLNDFRRLDPRFTLPRQTWDQIPAYENYGFAVFQLSPAAAQESKQVHPMALEFDTGQNVRSSGGAANLFFPTVHIHDGQVHAREHFDHALYFQARNVEAWRALPARPVASAAGLGRFVKPERAKNIVAAGAPGYKMTLRGMLPNRDVWVRTVAV